MRPPSAGGNERPSEAQSLYNTHVSNSRPPKDIEDEEYIYKVPCAARETISLRDSVPVPGDSKIIKKREMHKDSKDIQLTELKTSLVEVSERMTEEEDDMAKRETSHVTTTSIVFMQSSEDEDSSRGSAAF